MSGALSSISPALLLVGGSAGVGLLLLAIARPALACALLAAAIPLTAGLGRGTVVPLLRVNEALLLVVGAGVLVGRLPRRRPMAFTGIDVAVVAFCLGSMLIPWGVLLLTRAPADQQDWTAVFGPAQFLAVYLLYSRVDLTEPALCRVLKWVLLASIPVGLVAVAELVDLGGIRAFVANWYPPVAQPAWDTVYRPASLLGFYSAVGAYGLLNFLLALALAATRHPAYSQKWLAVVMAVNFVGMLACETYAPLLAFPAGTIAVLVVARRVPWRLFAAAVPALFAAVLVLAPIIAGRIQEELSGGAGANLPESFATRVTYWQGFFVPALLAHGLWLGTGTLIPSEVPRPLITFVDNGYLYQAFRAGLPGLALEALLLAALVAGAWRARSAADPSRRALGATCLGAVVCLLLVDTTSEYLWMAAVSQEFWMLAGLLAATALAGRSEPQPFVEVRVRGLGAPGLPRLSVPVLGRVWAGRPRLPRRTWPRLPRRPGPGGWKIDPPLNPPAGGPGGEWKMDPPFDPASGVPGGEWPRLASRTRPGRWRPGSTWQIDPPSNPPAGGRGGEWVHVAGPPPRPRSPLPAGVGRWGPPLARLLLAAVVVPGWLLLRAAVLLGLLILRGTVALARLVGGIALVLAWLLGASADLLARLARRAAPHLWRWVARELDGPARAGRVLLRRVLAKGSLVRSALAVLTGFGLARLLGFAFQVASGRLLAPAGYGRLTYALAVASVGSILLSTAPTGLSRFLARYAGRRADQEAYLSNWLAVISLLLCVSVAATVVAAPPLGLGGWLLAGLLANLLGVAALETYREVQRGLGRYALQSAFYVLANGLQLVVVMGLALLGWRSAALFLAVYGLSGVAALLAFLPLSGHSPRLRVDALRWSRAWEVVRFLRPLLAQAVFWNVWFSGDLILVQHFRSPADTGTYAAAKAIANGFAIIPSALSFVLAPRVARLDERQVRGQLIAVLALTAAVVVPLAAVVAVAARPLTGVLFGGRYQAAAVPLIVLTAGMSLFSLKSVLGGLWLGLGHPIVQTAGTGVAMVATLVTGLLLVPGWGSMGAAVAFSAGALAQLVVEGAVTVWAFGGDRPRVRQRTDGVPATARRPGDGPGAALAEGRAGTLGKRAPAALRRRPAPEAGRATRQEPAPVLLLAEELDSVPDEGYTKFANEIADRLGERRRLVRHSTEMGSWDSLGPVRALRRALQLAWAVWRCDAPGPAVVVYLSRSSVTMVALLRARLQRLLSRGAPVVFVGLQQFTVRSRRLLRVLAPDLILVPTERDWREARRAGVRAARIWSGVDLERFRPPQPGEKAALRRRWNLPVDGRVLLHVGHLREGRNLAPLAALAAAGATVVLVASGRRGPESERLRQVLVAAGVVLVEGYQPHVEDLYRLADCYVFTTGSRGDAIAMPLSVLEALASSLPVASLRFGTLPERLGDQPGVAFADTDEELVERALELAGSPVPTRHLAEPYGWDAVTGWLAGLLDDVTLLAASRPPVRGRLAAVRAKVRRSFVDRRSWPRRLFWGSRLAYECRPPAFVPVELPEAAEPSVRPPAGPAQPGPDLVGLLGRPAPGALAAAVAVSGLQVEEAPRLGLAFLVERAVRERWPLLHARVEDLAVLPDVRWRSLAAFVHRGGTLYVDGVRPSGRRCLAELGRQLGLQAPVAVAPFEASAVAFPREQAAFAGELAGARLEASCCWPGLAPRGGWEPLALAVAGRDRLPVLARGQVGAGSVVLATAPSELECRLADAFAAGSTQAAAAALPLLLLRARYGPAAWHAPAVVANLTIDDPALRRGWLGLRWGLLLDQARDLGFHVTIATVPRELRLAEPAVVELIRRHPSSLSVCYHGCDHESYEFYAPEARRTRYTPRPLAGQRQALDRALAHGRRFLAAHGLELDRVMVFPYGVGPAEIFPDLHRLGFIASCNYGDKYPPGGHLPADADLGLRPADLAWAGFPLLWRRGLRDAGFPLDRLLGRPSLTFAHTRALGADFTPFAERARAVDRLAGGTAAWCSLDEVARHAYLQRRRPGGDWEVLMTASEVCLHNPELAPRIYAVRRPYRPADSVFEVAGVPVAGEPLVTVPPTGTVVVRLVPAGALSGAAPRRCSIFAGPPAGPGGGWKIDPPSNPRVGERP